MHKQLNTLLELLSRGTDFTAALELVATQYNLTSRQLELLADLYNWEQS
jgi:hypothetical protein